MLCFVLINRVPLNLLRVRITFPAGLKVSYVVFCSNKPSSFESFTR